jgi:hypothetical protein
VWWCSLKSGLGRKGIDRWQSASKGIETFAPRRHLLLYQLCSNTDFTI